jgi:hypothetical protein
LPFHNHLGITVQLSFTSEWQHSHATSKAPERSARSNVTSFKPATVANARR